MMRITSPAFDDGGDIPDRYTLDGGNLSPPLRFHHVPEGTRSLALIVDDIDSPLGTFTHWVIWNIPLDTTELADDTVPPQAELGMNGFGTVGYAGPCPPSGRHRYRFRLFALNTVLEATSPDRKDQIESEVEGATIERAAMTGRYQARE